jgi:hypothetical protein
LGEHKLNEDPDCATTEGSSKCSEVQTYKSSEFITIVHPKYDKTELINDIALIYLKKPAKITESVAPICLPFDEPELPKNVQVIGFGQTEKYWKPYSDVLTQATLKVINEGCAEEYKKLTNMTREITNNQFCASENVRAKVGKNVIDTTVDTCKGNLKHLNKFIRTDIIN